MLNPDTQSRGGHYLPIVSSQHTAGTSVHFSVRLVSVWFLSWCGPRKLVHTHKKPLGSFAWLGCVHTRGSIVGTPEYCKVGTHRRAPYMGGDVTGKCIWHSYAGAYCVCVDTQQYGSGMLAD